jgi:tRNA A-37 threonylcarbamoyl transferase component Bud32
MERAEQLKRTARAFLGLACVLGLFVLSLYIFIAANLIRWGPLTREPGWTSVRKHDGWYVQNVDARGPAGGKLQPGDRIVAVGGDERFSRIHPDLKLRFLATERSYSARVNRAGIDHEFQVEFPPANHNRNLVWALSLYITGLVFYAVGMLMGLLRPGYSLTRLGCVSSLVTATHIGGLLLRSVRMFLGGAGRIVDAVAQSVAPWHMTLGYHFFSRFPSAVPETLNWSAFRVFLYLYSIVVWAPRVILIFVATLNESSAIGFYERYADPINFYFEHLFSLEGAFKLIVAIGICLVLLRNYKLLAGMPDQRRRVRWVLAAAGIGIALPAIFVLIGMVRHSANLPRTGSYPINIVITNLVAAIIPFALAYAVIKHRVLGISVVLRRSLQYLLAKQSLRIFLLLPVVLLASGIAAHPDRTIADIVIGNSRYPYLFLAASAGVGLRYRRELTNWLDRKFFREQYDREIMLLDLVEYLKRADSVPEIAVTIGTQIDAALHPSALHVFYRTADGEAFVPVHSSFGSGSEISLPQGLVQSIGECRSAIHVIPGQGAFPNDVGDALQRLGALLLVPVRNSQQQLAGVLILGEKKSEEPYTTSDRNLLQAVAAQMGLVVDLVRLKDRVESEQKMREHALSLLDGGTLNFVKECPECGACFDASQLKCPVDESVLASPTMLERVIDGKYRLDHRIGSGSFGSVYEAWDLRLKRKVAIKAITGAVLANKAALRRFQREAQAAARLNHRNIIAIYDYGLARPDGAYLCMELVSGLTLRSELRRSGVIAPAVLADWLDQLLEGVSVAHHEGVIHRDLKPENILIALQKNGSGVIKILDFGLAKLRRLDLTDPEKLTVAGTVVGTMGYMSPEQFTGAEADERSDIFSLGVIAVEALTGSRPFNGRTPTDLLRAVLHDSVELRGEGREIKELNRVLRHCLAKNVSDRYRSVGEMRRELIPVIRNCRPFTLQVKADEGAQTATFGG